MKRMALLCLSLVTLFTFTTLGSSACCSVEAFFVSPSVDGVIESRIIELLDNAEDSIYIAMYSFTDDELGAAVIEAHKRGVEVQILLDDGQNSDKGGREYPKLIDAGITVSVKHVTGSLHHKFVVIDGRLVITGSYNWSDNADDDNFENVLIVRCTEIADAYVAEFEGISKNSSKPNGRSNGCEECLRRINEATFTKLEKCSKIGDASAQRIVEHQPFTVHTCTRTTIRTALEELWYIESVRSEAVLKCLCGDLDLD